MALVVANKNSALSPVVIIQTGDTLADVSQRLTGNKDNYTEFKLLHRDGWRPKKPFEHSLVYPNDVLYMPRHLLLPVVAVELSV